MVRTSRPCVGLLNTTTRGSNDSSRASSAFWMLPPLSLPMFVSGDGVRMSNSLMSSLAVALMAGRSIDPLRQ